MHRLSRRAVSGARLLAAALLWAAPALALAQTVPAPLVTPVPMASPPPAAPLVTPLPSAAPTPLPAAPPVLAPEATPLPAPPLPPPPAPATPSPYGYVITPHPPAPGTPGITEIALTARTIHPDRAYALRVTTTPDVRTVALEAYGARDFLRPVAPGRFELAGTVPDVPRAYLNRTYVLEIVAATADGRTASARLPIRLAP